VVSRSQLEDCGAIVQAEVGNAVNFAMEGVVPGTISGHQDAGRLISELVCGDIDDEVVQLEPGVNVAPPFSKHEMREPASVYLEILGQKKGGVAAGAAGKGSERHQGAAGGIASLDGEAEPEGELEERIPERIVHGFPKRWLAEKAEPRGPAPSCINITPKLTTTRSPHQSRTPGSIFGNAG